jgi:hypothetical protein
LSEMIRQERTPRLRGRLSMADHVSRDRRLADGNPSLSNSPWIRGAPQSGFVCDIVRIKARTSVETRGRPMRRRLFHVQNNLMARRCQPTTVCGLTMTSAVRHAVQTRDNHPTQSQRSAGGVAIAAVAIVATLVLGDARPAPQSAGQLATASVLGRSAETKAARMSSTRSLSVVARNINGHNRNDLFSRHTWRHTAVYARSKRPSAHDAGPTT